MENQKNERTYFLFHWILFFLLGFLGLMEFLKVNILAFVPQNDLLKSQRFIVFLFTSFSLLTGWICYFVLHDSKIVQKLIGYLRGFPEIFKTLTGIGILFLPAIIKWLLPLPDNFTLQSWTMVFLFYGTSLSVSAIFTEENSIMKHLLQTATFFMISGFGYSISARINLVTSYPFTTYWSEGNRFFDYSTLLGSFRYIIPKGESIRAFTNWGMALPWALPFLLPNLSIGAFRLWNQLVWILPSFILGYVAINKKKEKNKFLIAVLFGLWTYLFLDQGPIYSPLIIGAILTIIAVRMRLPFGIILVFIASYYVRSARWTWGYTPGLWAGLLSILDIENPSLNLKRIKEFGKPVALGIAGYVGGKLLPSIINVFKRGSQLSFLPNASESLSRQPLLWERLWPNPTFPPGIVLGLLWAVLPVVIFITVLIIKKYWKLNLIQYLSVLTICSAFLVVGVIISTKIGGGSNLHNTDMFLISILFVLSAAINNLANRINSTQKYEWLWVIPMIICLISPVTYSLQKSERLELPPAEKVSESISAVQNKVKEYSALGEILFIDHRHLLTFNLVKNVPFIDDYEKKYLMDNALASKASYFDAFYKDLDAQRFVLIINEPANIISRGSDHNFGEENDAYVKWVAAPLLCKYEPLYTSHATALELLVPRTTPAPEYLPCDEIYNNLNE